MDDEILKSTALRSLDDFDWLSTADKVFCKADVASGGKAKRISPNQ
jgi:ABC-type phosphate/phosphonate transport system ATPase subunit